MHNKSINYNVTLEVIGPVHVGSGTDINKKDCLYMENEKRVYIMDPIKVFEGMKKNNLLKDYDKFLMDPSQKNFISFVRYYNISPDEYKSWTAYILPLNDITAVNISRSKGGGVDTISAFVKDAYGCPYIPGSSLKGALRTVFENSLIIKDREKYSDIAKTVENEIYEKRQRYLTRASSDLSKRVFNTLERNETRGSAANDIFSFLRVSDSAPLSTSDLVLCQKIDMSTDGTANLLPIKRECIRPGTKISFSIEVDRSYMDIQGKYFDITDKSIYDAIDMTFKNYYDTFLSSFKKITSLDNAAGHLMYIGGGSGFGTKTSVYPLFQNKERAVCAVEKIMVNTTPSIHKHRYDVRDHNVSPHMRKCTKYKGQIYDMGVCRIEVNL